MFQNSIYKHQTAFKKKYRLADFFERWWDTYAKNPKQYISPEQYKAVNAIRVCRTPALGVDIYACPDCGEQTKVYHSCKNRFCPTCSWKDTLKWAERVKNQMMNIPHRHLVMTLPHQLNQLIKNNDKYLLNVLMRVTAKTIKNWMEYKYNLKPGIISVLHTFGETKNYHPHIHMIVSWGGIEKTSGMLKSIDSLFVNYKFLQQKFRCMFEDELVMMYDMKQLKHSFTNRAALLLFLKMINKNKWVLHFEPPMEIPQQVIRYIGRYSKRTCLSEYKITKMEGEYISFRYKAYTSLDKNKKPIEKVMELHYRDFFPRLLQHVPLKGFRLVRYYGVYSNKYKVPQEYLSNDTEVTVSKEQSINMEAEEIEQCLICKKCGKRKIYQFTLIINRLSLNKKIYERKELKGYSKNSIKAA